MKACIKNNLMGHEKAGKKCLVVLLIILTIVLSGCGNGKATVTNPGGMKKVGSYNVEQEVTYTDESEREAVKARVSSTDGLCVIEEHDSYYDVILDYEKGTPTQVGEAYAETILKACPDYEARLEPYLYENIKMTFDGREVNYDSLEKRIRTLEANIPEEYRIELESYAKAMSRGEEGFQENGRLSYIELLTAQMIPDALRPTACSALSLWGTKTTTGERISLRNLEWRIGSTGQMTGIHAVTRMKKGDGSLTMISMLGLFDVITAVNDDGVMLGILDVGSKLPAPFVYEGKKCYTYEARYALEHFSTAREAGEFLVGESGDFTWCNNLFLTDKEEAFCCENATEEVAAAGRARSVLRDAASELLEGLKWDNPDSLCVVNSFATKGNQDAFSGEPYNMNRWMKYRNYVREKEKFSLGDVKAIMAHEIVDQHEVANVHNSGTVHTVIVDYATGTIHVSFTKGMMAEDVPHFVDIGRY